MFLVFPLFKPDNPNADPLAFLSNHRLHLQYEVTTKVTITMSEKKIISNKLNEIEAVIDDAHRMVEKDTVDVGNVDQDLAPNRFANIVNPKEVMALKKAFLSADVDRDGFLTERELADFIHEKAVEHLDEAVLDAAEEFEKIRPAAGASVVGAGKNGISFSDWQNFEEKRTNKILNPDEVEFEQESFDLADGNNDKLLSVYEYRCFRHAELCEHTLTSFGKETFNALDRDHNRKINMDEYIALPPGEVDEAQKNDEKQWQDSQREEFQEIDRDADGEVTFDELIEFLHPRNPMHAVDEAQELIENSDKNNDGKLVMDEVLGNSHLFLGSKMLNAGQSYHHEF